MPQSSQRCDEFLDRLGAIVRRGGSESVTVAAVKEHMSAAIEKPGWLPARCLRSTPDCYARHLLHLDAEGRFAVVVMVWEPGQKTMIHDHGGVWCVEGVYEGRIRVRKYDLDDPVSAGTARFHQYEIIEAGTGTTGALIPPVDYHLIENPFDRTAVTVHTYGGEMKTCHVYLPREDGSFEVCPKELAYTTRPDRLAALASGRG